MVIHYILPKNFKNFFKWEKIQLQFSKSEIFWKKKIKIPIYSRHFFWNHERSEVPPASLARSVLKPCAPKPCAPNYDSPHLPTAAVGRGNDLPTYRKSFSDFAENFFIISSEKIKFLNFGKSVKKLSYGFKNQF